MAAIQFTDRGVPVRVSGESSVLARAALTAGKAPSILNTQPWRWRVDGRLLELRADRHRQVTGLDPDGRLLTLSCGVALHHVRVALATEGADIRVVHLPDSESGHAAALPGDRDPSQRSSAVRRRAGTG
jgi:hypothetical protein